MRSPFREKFCKRISRELLREVVALEEKRSIFVRWFRISCTGYEVRCAVGVVKNAWGDSREERDIAKNQILHIFAGIWCRFRIDKMIINCDLSEGAISFRVRDFGVVKAPELSEVFESARIAAGQGGDMALDGFIYEDPSMWRDGFVEVQDAHKSIRQILADDPDYCKSIGYHLGGGVLLPEE